MHIYSCDERALTCVCDIYMACGLLTEMSDQKICNRNEKANCNITNGNTILPIYFSPPYPSHSPFFCLFSFPLCLCFSVSLSPSPLSLAQAHRLARYGVVTFLTAGLTFVLACPTHAPAFRQL